MTVIITESMRVSGSVVAAGTVTNALPTSVEQELISRRSALRFPNARAPAFGVPAGPLVSMTNQIKVGSYGDSIARISNASTQDLAKVTTGNKDLRDERMGYWLTGHSRGALRVIFDGGVSGETSTQMVAREGAGSSATRKSMQDARDLGVQVLVVSGPINDLLAISSASSQSVIDAAVATAVTNFTAQLRKARAFGIHTVTLALLPYSANGETAANIATRQAASRAWNAAMAAVIEAARGGLGDWCDVSRFCADQSGGWLQGYTVDGTHPSANACRVIYKPVADLICARFGVQAPQFALPGTSVNLFSNADFTAATSGLATNLTRYAQSGTATFANQIYAADGINWQEIVYTPTVLDGSSNVNCALDIACTVTGGSPFVAISAGDLIAGEVDVYFDDGAGGPPPIFSFGGRMRMNGTATVYSDVPAYGATPTAKVRFTEPTLVKICTIPVQAVDASAALTGCLMQLFAVTDQLTTPVRMIVGTPRVVKLPSTY